MAKDKIIWTEQDIADFKEALRNKHRDPKGKAKPTVKHPDRTKYKRKPKHVRNTTDE